MRWRDRLRGGRDDEDGADETVDGEDASDAVDADGDVDLEELTDVTAETGRSGVRVVAEDEGDDDDDEWLDDLDGWIDDAADSDDADGGDGEVAGDDGSDDVRDDGELAEAAGDDGADPAVVEGNPADETLAPRAVPVAPVQLGVVDEDAYADAVRRVVTRALAEDLGSRGDLTSSITVPIGTAGQAEIIARQAGVLAGLDVIAEVVEQVDPRITIDLRAADGDRVQVGDIVASLRGPLRTLLTAERTILNIVCQLSGVATHTAAFAEVLEGTACVVRDTRKTTPGLRLLEKRAVVAGGGANHRIGLGDAILVKDNHVAAAGGVLAASRAALAGAPEGVHVQVEVTTAYDALDAIHAGVEDILLDNFSPEELAHAIELIDGRAAVEASGGITLETARAYAEAGADRLAVGALTHSAPALDLAMDVAQVDGRQDD